MDLTPSGVLATWGAGLGAGLVVVARWRIVGPGYVWLAAGVMALFALPAAAAGTGWWAYAGSGCALAAAAAARLPRVVMALAGSGALLLGAGAMADGIPLLLVVTGGAFLGAVTSEMMLGHWYLVDPRLPRPALRALAVIGAGGAAADAVAVSMSGAVPWDDADAVMGVGFLLLAASSVVLMLLVRSSLGERGYSGVMSATGLSYLAVLTAIGAMVLGRMLV